MTARYAVVGNPISHSLSPVIQQAAFDALGRNARYDAIRTTEAELPGILEQIRTGHLDGVNVTMPLKHAAYLMADRVEGGARRAQSVNTLVRDGDGVAGFSTDIAAIQNEWRRAALPTGAALLLGSGGAAAAALVALDGWQVYGAARSPDRLATLSAELGATVHLVPWGEGVPGVVVVNATPIGMHGESLPPAILEEADGLFDMPYASLPTRAVIAAKGLGLPVVQGLDMLVAQAAISFELWTGTAPPIPTMREAAQIAQGW